MRRDVFQAVADPTRRAIIGLIAFQPMTPNAIAEKFHTTRQAVSKHIGILNDCELLTVRVSGREIYYQCDIEKIKEIDVWLEQFRELWSKRFDQLDEILQKSKTNKHGKK